MKRLIFLHVDISKKINTLLTLIITSSFFFTSSIYADEKWEMDKELSTISFELPVLFVKNVQGTFQNIEGFVEIDLDKKEKSKVNKLNTKKKDFLVILSNNTGNISESCRKANIGRSTFYLWFNNDSDFKKEVESVREDLLDFAESKLWEKIVSGNLTAIIFYLKCQGQKRGYIDKQYIENATFRVKDEVVIR